MKKQNMSPLAEASIKFNVNPVNFQFDLPMLEVILQTKAEVEALSAQPPLANIWVILAVSKWGNKYIKTTADGEQPNNLLSLPECP